MSKNENIGQNNENFSFSSRELQKSPESKWVPRFGVLVIAGDKGAGSSTLAKRLAADYGIPTDPASNRYLEVGTYIRKGIEEDSGKKILDFVERDPQIDYTIDQEVRNIVMRADRNEPKIVEAQLGGLIALDTLKHATEGKLRPSAPVIKVLVWARVTERVKRIQEREGGLLKAIRAATRNREEKDLVYWKSLYEWMGDINPLEKDARDADGKRIYEYEIDSSDKNPEEVHQELHEFLLNVGAVEEKRDLFLGYQRPISGN